MPGPAQVDRVTAPRNPAGTHPAAGLQFWAIPQARHWLLWGALLSAAVLTLGLTAQLVPGGSTAELVVDQDLSQHHSALLTGLAMVLNVVFGPAAGVVLVAAVALYLWVVRRSLAKAVAFGLVACSGWVASEFFKLIIARQRPNPALLFDPLSPETGSNSFPSGHVSFAVALGFALYFLARGTRWAKPTAVAAVALALLVAWSRLYIGVHYPTDVAASFLAASAAVLLLAGLWNRFAPRILDSRPAGRPQPQPVQPDLKEVTMHGTYASGLAPALTAAAGNPSLLDPASLLEGLGPAALGVISLMVFIESGVLFPFLPGDSLLFTAGLLHEQLQLTLPVLIGVVTAAAVAGDQVGYMIGRKYGRRWFKDDARILKTAHLTTTEDFFRRHGGAAVVLARFVPMVRTFAPLSAGIARYEYKSFTLWNIAGALAWGSSVTLLGTWLGHYEIVAKNIDVIAVVMVLVSVLPWGVQLLKRRRRNRGAAAESTADPSDDTAGDLPAEGMARENS